jgi:hypothetical protein
MKTALLLVATAILGLNALSLRQATAGDEAKLAVSYRAKTDFALTADPQAAAWKAVPGVFADKGRRGETIAHHRTEIRSQWTPKNLYFLFICPYEHLHLKPNPSTTTETNLLWEWDVAEVFIGTDFDNIKHYTEFQVSPQGEWVDLDIDRTSNPAKHDVGWNSGFEVKAQIDRDKKVWFGAMRIPLAKIDRRQPKDGLEMRINFYRIQGPGPDRKMINWQPVNNDSFHTPEAFGRLRLSAKAQ